MSVTVTFIILILLDFYNMKMCFLFVYYNQRITTIAFSFPWSLTDRSRATNSYQEVYKKRSLKMVKTIYKLLEVITHVILFLYMEENKLQPEQDKFLIRSILQSTYCLHCCTSLYYRFQCFWWYKFNYQCQQ